MTPHTPSPSPVEAVASATSSAADIVQRLRTRNGRSDGFGLGLVCDEAADTIEALLLDVEMAKAAREVLYSQIAKQSTQIAELEQDAKRYRLLRNQTLGVPDGVAAISVCAWDVQGFGKDLVGADLDATVDAMDA